MEKIIEIDISLYKELYDYIENAMKNPNIENDVLSFKFDGFDFTIEDSLMLCISDFDEDKDDYAFSLDITRKKGKNEIKNTIAFYDTEEINKETIDSKIDYILFI